MCGPSIHDNRVTSYEVDGENRRITLHTLFDEIPNRLEYTDMVFEGVMAYRFENDNFGNILLDVEEVPVAQLVANYRGLFEEGSRFAWPGSWNVSIEACVAQFQSKGAKAFDISSSYALCGWVIAESYRLEARAMDGPLT